MKVEISKAQKEALGQKINLCVTFLKNEVQPHIVKSDTIVVNMSDYLDLYITNSRIYVTETKPLIPGIDLYRKRVLFLERPVRKNASKYICEACPDRALEFLKNWDRAKATLSQQVEEKKKQVEDFNRFVDDFQL